MSELERGLVSAIMASTETVGEMVPAAELQAIRALGCDSVLEAAQMIGHLDSQIRTLLRENEELTAEVTKQKGDVGRWHEFWEGARREAESLSQENSRLIIRLASFEHSRPDNR